MARSVGNVQLNASINPASIRSINRQIASNVNAIPLNFKLDAKGFKAPLGRITNDINQFHNINKYK